MRPVVLRTDWYWVRPLLEHVRAKTGEDWFPEDVYAAVSTQRAAMWVGDDPEAVLVAYADKEEWSGETVLHVWIAAGDMETDGEAGYKVLADAAKAVGAKRMVMDSPRSGWQRKGWKVRRYVYEREL